MQANKVSVLVAVYNAEKYLSKCLDSLISQTYKNIEIICIDDCSKDSSAKILNKYASSDNRIKILTLAKNSGQANARNEGLKIASGEYITMLDSDDWFADDSIEKAVEAIESVPDADVSVFRLMQCYEETGKIVEYENKTDKKCMSGWEAFRLSLDWSMHGLYLVRADIHKKYPFDNSCLLYSDDNTTRLHYLHSRKVIMSEGKYFYRKHAESMTSSCSIRRFDMLGANYSMMQQLKKEAKEGNLKDADKILNFYETTRWLNMLRPSVRAVRASISTWSWIFRRTATAMAKTTRLYCRISACSLPSTPLRSTRPASTPAYRPRRCRIASCPITWRNPIGNATTTISSTSIRISTGKLRCAMLKKSALA